MAVSSRAISRVPVTSRKMMKMLISLSRERSSHTIIWREKQRGRKEKRNKQTNTQTKREKEKSEREGEKEGKESGALH